MTTPPPAQCEIQGHDMEISTQSGAGTPLEQLLRAREAEGKAKEVRAGTLTLLSYKLHVCRNDRVIW